MRTHAKIYVMRGERAIKIGMSERPIKRMRSVSYLRGEKLTLEFASRPVRNARIIEVEAHRRLARQAVGGEWFNATVDEAIDAIEGAIACVEPTYFVVGIPKRGDVLRWVKRPRECPEQYWELIERLRDTLIGDWPERWQ